MSNPMSPGAMPSARLAEAGLQCPAPADFLAPAAAPAAPAATTPAGQRRVATARREVEVSRARVAIEQRHGNGRPLHRSEERRVGKECVRRCRTGWSLYT